MPRLDYSTLDTFPPVIAGEDNIITEHRDAHNAAVALYRGVAAHLPGWTFEQTINDRSWYGPQYRYKLVDSAGHAISLEFGRYHVQRGNVKISGYWPQKGMNGAWTSSSDVRENSPSINVSLDRSHAVIAKQIQTRFLPEYLRIYALILTKLAEQNAYEDRKAGNWKRLIDAKLVIDPRQAPGGDYRGELRIGTKGPDGWNYSQGYGSVRMSGEDSVTFELHSLPVDTAMRVLRALQGDKV